MNLFNFAAGIWGAYLDSSVPIVVSSQFNPLTPCSSGGGFNRNVKIELSTDSGATYPTVIASDVANTGSYTFNVPYYPDISRTHSRS